MMINSERVIAILTLLVDALYQDAYLSSYDQKIRFNCTDDLVAGIMKLFDPDRFDEKVRELQAARAAELAAKEEEKDAAD